MSDTTAPVGIIVPAAGIEPDPECNIKYLPPVDIFTGPRIADALERITDTLSEINAKLDGLARLGVPKRKKNKYTIYVSSACVREEINVIGVELDKDGEQVNAWTALTNKDPVHSMLLAIYSCLQQISLRKDTLLPVVVITDEAMLVDALNLNGKFSENIISLVEHLDDHAVFGIAPHVEEPTHHMLANVIREIMTERQKVCLQLQETESSTQMEK